MSYLEIWWCGCFLVFGFFLLSGVQDFLTDNILLEFSSFILFGHITRSAKFQSLEN